jgi:hypothetical protein
MGLFGSKNKGGDAGKPGAAQQRKTVTEAPGTSRKSVRRVVPAAKPGAVKPAAPAPRPATLPSARAVPAAEPVVDEVQLPPPAAEPDMLDLGTADTVPDAAPAQKRSGTQPILASSAPEFTGSLDANKRPSGPGRTGDKVLLEFLTGKGQLMSAEQAAAAATKAEAEGIPLDQACVAMGLITEEQLVNSLSQETWVPHLKVDKYEIRKKALDTIGRDDAQHFGVFPVDKLGNLLTLAMVNPLDAEAIRQLEGKTGLDIKKVVATRTEVAVAIDKYYGGKVVASEGSRSFSQDVGDSPKSATQMLTPAARAVPPPAPAASAPAPAPAAPPPAAIIPDIAGDIQDIDDLLAGEETIAPAIIEPVSIKPEDMAADLELSDAPITRPIHKPAESELEFGLQDAPKSETGALARSGDAPDLEKTDAIVPPPVAARAPAAPILPPAPKASAAAGAKVAAGAAGAKVINLVPVLEEEFRYAISHGKGKVFERWLALQSRNRIVNAVAVERELEGVLAGLYASPRKAG